MSTGKVVRFWNNIRTQSNEAYQFDDDAEPSPEHLNMEQLAKNVELAQSNVVHCQGELIKAETLLERCIERFHEERKRRGIPDGVK